jgi:beta-lactamase superfamily II metal-dependent hydrolase
VQEGLIKVLMTGYFSSTKREDLAQQWPELYRVLLVAHSRTSN